MPCKPCAARARNRPTYEVALGGGKGRVVYTSTSKATAEAVAKRPAYRDAGAIVREKAKPAQQK